MNTAIVRARAGDAAAIRAVVDRLRPRLTRMAQYYAVRVSEDADDLLQEAWLGLLDGLREVDVTIGSPEQFLIQRARWRLLDAVKRGQVRRCLPLDMGIGERADPLRDTAWEEAMAAEFARILKTTQREILLCLLRGLTWREVGEQLGCSSANVAYHVRQIQRRYREWSEDEAFSKSARPGDTVLKAHPNIPRLRKGGSRL